MFHLFASPGVAEREEEWVHAGVFGGGPAAGAAPELDDAGVVVAVPGGDVVDEALGVGVVAVVCHEVGDGDEGGGVFEGVGDVVGLCELGLGEGVGDVVELACFGVDGRGVLAVDVRVGVDDGDGGRSQFVGFFGVVEVE